MQGEMKYKDIFLYKDFDQEIIVGNERVKRGWLDKHKGEYFYWIYSCLLAKELYFQQNRMPGSNIQQIQQALASLKNNIYKQDELFNEQKLLQPVYAGLQLNKNTSSQVFPKIFIQKIGISNQKIFDLLNQEKHLHSILLEMMFLLKEIYNFANQNNKKVALSYKKFYNQIQGLRVKDFDIDFSYPITFENRDCYTSMIYYRDAGQHPQEVATLQWTDPKVINEKYRIIAKRKQKNRPFAIYIKSSPDDPLQLPVQNATQQQKQQYDDYHKIQLIQVYNLLQAQYFREGKGLYSEGSKNLMNVQQTINNLKIQEQQEKNPQGQQKIRLEIIKLENLQNEGNKLKNLLKSLMAQTFIERMQQYGDYLKSNPLVGLNIKPFVEFDKNAVKLLLQFWRLKAQQNKDEEEKEKRDRLMGSDLLKKEQQEKIQFLKSIESLRQLNQQKMSDLVLQWVKIAKKMKIDFDREQALKGQKLQILFKDVEIDSKFKFVKPTLEISFEKTVMEERNRTINDEITHFEINKYYHAKLYGKPFKIQRSEKIQYTLYDSKLKSTPIFSKEDYTAQEESQRSLIKNKIKWLDTKLEDIKEKIVNIIQFKKIDPIYMFNMIDTSGDGELQANEFYHLVLLQDFQIIMLLFQLLKFDPNITEDESNHVYEAFDVNKDGSISLSEWKKILEETNDRMKQAQLKLAEKGEQMNLSHFKAQSIYDLLSAKEKKVYDNLSQEQMMKLSTMDVQKQKKFLQSLANDKVVFKQKQNYFQTTVGNYEKNDMILITLKDECDEDENESFNVFKTSIPFYDLIDVLKFGKDLYLSLNKKLQINQQQQKLDNPIIHIETILLPPPKPWQYKNYKQYIEERLYQKIEIYDPIYDDVIRFPDYTPKHFKILTQIAKQWNVPEFNLKYKTGQNIDPQEKLLDLRKLLYKFYLENSAKDNTMLKRNYDFMIDIQDGLISLLKDEANKELQTLSDLLSDFNYSFNLFDPNQVSNNNFNIYQKLEYVCKTGIPSNLRNQVWSGLSNKKQLILEVQANFIQFVQSHSNAQLKDVEQRVLNNTKPLYIQLKEFSKLVPINRLRQDVFDSMHDFQIYLNQSKRNHLSENFWSENMVNIMYAFALYLEINHSRLTFSSEIIQIADKILSFQYSHYTDQLNELHQKNLAQISQKELQQLKETLYNRVESESFWLLVSMIKSNLGRFYDLTYNGLDYDMHFRTSPNQQLPPNSTDIPRHLIDFSKMQQHTSQILKDCEDKDDQQSQGIAVKKIPQSLGFDYQQNNQGKFISQKFPLVQKYTKFSNLAEALDNQYQSEFKKYLNNNHCGLKKDIVLLRILMKEFLPEVTSKLISLGLPIDYFFGQYYLNLFCDFFPNETLFRIWDILFFENAQGCRQSFQVYQQFYQNTNKTQQIQREINPIDSQSSLLITAIILQLLLKAKSVILNCKFAHDVELVIKTYGKFLFGVDDFIHKVCILKVQLFRYLYRHEKLIHPFNLELDLFFRTQQQQNILFKNFVNGIYPFQNFPNSDNPIYNKVTSSIPIDYVVCIINNLECQAKLSNLNQLKIIQQQTDPSQQFMQQLGIMSQSVSPSKFREQKEMKLSYIQQIQEKIRTIEFEIKQLSQSLDIQDAKQQITSKQKEIQLLQQEQQKMDKLFQDKYQDYVSGYVSNIQDQYVATRPSISTIHIFLHKITLFWSESSELYLEVRYPQQSKPGIRLACDTQCFLNHYEQFEYKSGHNEIQIVIYEDDTPIKQLFNVDNIFQPAITLKPQQQQVLNDSSKKRWIKEVRIDLNTLTSDKLCKEVYYFEDKLKEQNLNLITSEIEVSIILSTMSALGKNIFTDINSQKLLNDRLARSSSCEPDKILNEPHQFHSFICEDSMLSQSIHKLNLSKYYAQFKKLIRNCLGIEFLDNSSFLIRKDDWKKNSINDFSTFKRIVRQAEFDMQQNLKLERQELQSQDLTSSKIKDQRKQEAQKRLMNTDSTIDYNLLINTFIHMSNNKNFYMSDYLILIVLFSKSTFNQKCSVLFDIVNLFEDSPNLENNDSISSYTLKRAIGCLYEMFLVFMPQSEVDNIIDMILHGKLNQISKATMTMVPKLQQSLDLGENFLDQTEFNFTKVLQALCNYNHQHKGTKDVYLGNVDKLNVLDEVLHKCGGEDNALALIQEKQNKINQIDIKYTSQGLKHRLKLLITPSFQIERKLVLDLTKQELPTHRPDTEVPIKPIKNMMFHNENVLSLNNNHQTINREQFVEVMKKVPLIRYLMGFENLLTQQSDIDSYYTIQQQQGQQKKQSSLIIIIQVEKNTMATLNFIKENNAIQVFLEQQEDEQQKKPSQVQKIKQQTIQVQYDLQTPIHNWTTNSKKHAELIAPKIDMQYLNQQQYLEEQQRQKQLEMQQQALKLSLEQTQKEQQQIYQEQQKQQLKISQLKPRFDSMVLVNSYLQFQSKPEQQVKTDQFGQQIQMGDEVDQDQLSPLKKSHHLYLQNYEKQLQQQLQESSKEQIQLAEQQQLRNKDFFTWVEGTNISSQASIVQREPFQLDPSFEYILAMPIVEAIKYLQSSFLELANQELTSLINFQVQVEGLRQQGRQKIKEILDAQSKKQIQQENIKIEELKQIYEQYKMLNTWLHPKLLEIDFTSPTYYLECLEFPSLDRQRNILSFFDALMMTECSKPKNELKVFINYKIIEKEKFPLRKTKFNLHIIKDSDWKTFGLETDEVFNQLALYRYSDQSSEWLPCRVLLKYKNEKVQDPQTKEDCLYFAVVFRKFIDCTYHKFKSNTQKTKRSDFSQKHYYIRIAQWKITSQIYQNQN